MKFSTLVLALLVAAAASVPTVYAQTGLQVDVGSGIKANTGSGSASTTQGGTIRINTGSKKEEERSGLLKNALGIEVRSSADVMSDEDLDSYEENLLVTNASVADADSSNKRVGVAYWHEGRLLWVFPVKVQSRTDVEIGEEENLSISTDMPWWSFLVSGLGNVKSKVEAALMSNGQFTADVLAASDAKARARALEAIASAHARVAAGE